MPTDPLRSAEEAFDHYEVVYAKCMVPGCDWKEPIDWSELEDPQAGAQLRHKAHWDEKHAPEVPLDPKIIQWHLERLIAMLAGGPTNTNIEERAPIWVMRAEALDALKGKDWQHEVWEHNMRTLNRYEDALKLILERHPDAKGGEHPAVDIARKALQLL